MSARMLVIRHLIFTGPEVKPARLDFELGCNLVWGASNTGKSFTLKAIDFMLGGSGPLPDIEERRGYETVLLGFTIREVGDFTLSRSTSGGNFKLYEGLIGTTVTGAHSRVLSAKHNHEKEDNLSNFLLSHLGFGGKFLAKNSYGETNSLSFRNLAHIMLVDETSIQAERSPIEKEPRDEVLEHSVFRLLLTGTDDSTISQAMTPTALRASKKNKVELLNEMIGEIEKRISDEFPEIDGFLDQEIRLSRTLEKIQSEFETARSSIRTLLEVKQELAIEIPRVSGRLVDIELHIGRFAQLDSVYFSDIERLEAIEEAGFLVSLGSSRECSLCGAKPEAQLHTQGIIHVDQVRTASIAEIAKIKQLRTDLERTIEGLLTERSTLQIELPKLEDRLATVESEIAELLPKVNDTQRALGEVLTARDQVRQGLALREQMHMYQLKRQEVESLRPIAKEDKPKLELSGVIAHDFCKVVSRVLSAWQFPGERSVSFDEATYDLRIDGKLRVNNGKGVRAVTHSAFKVALLIYCRERNLPHPGFVLLDTPLLTYRDPIKNTRFGSLAPDEAALAQTALKQKFFEHLHSIRELGQFIIFENIDLPENIGDLAKVDVFLGSDGGRSGLFPVPLKK